MQRGRTNKGWDDLRIGEKFKKRFLKSSFARTHVAVGAAYMPQCVFNIAMDVFSGKAVSLETCPAVVMLMPWGSRSLCW